MLNFKSSQNYFELFGLPVLFSLDVSELGARYRALQREAHPDRHTNCAPAEQRTAMQLSSLLNQAYDVLKDPIERAAYILKLQEIDTSESSTRQLSPKFLMEQIELRERLQETHAAAHPVRHLASLKKRVSDAISELLTICESQLASENYTGASDTVSKLQFYRKLLKSADDMMLRYE